jgi:PKD repeat protein
MPLISSSFSRSFRYGRAVTITSFITDDCGITQTIIPSAEDDYTLSDLGPPDPERTVYIIENGFVKYSINGEGSGALGGGVGVGYLDEIGLRYDPTGTGNYGIDDYIQPGTPWEGYTFQIDGFSYIGSNSDDYTYEAPDNTAKTWKLADNHVVTMMGNKTLHGLCICQYMTLPGEPAIRIKMTYTNTTASAKRVKISRGMDPDVDVATFDNYDTINSRGLGSIPTSDIALAIGAETGKPVVIYAPGNGYIHNTSIDDYWPQELPDAILNEWFNNEEDYDYAITAAWDCATVDPGQSVTVCVYYICASQESEVTDILGDTTGTQASPNFKASPNLGDAPLTVNFTNTSKNNTLNQWDFNNDDTIDSTEVNPTTVYSSPGIYSVGLTVSNASGSKKVVRENYITVLNIPQINVEDELTCTPTFDNSNVSSNVAWYKFFNSVADRELKVLITNSSDYNKFSKIAIYTSSGILYTEQNFSSRTRAITFIPDTIGYYYIALITGLPNYYGGNDEYFFQSGPVAYSIYPYPSECKLSLTLVDTAPTIDFIYKQQFLETYYWRYRYRLDFDNELLTSIESLSSPAWGQLVDVDSYSGVGYISEKFTDGTETLYLRYRKIDNIRSTTSYNTTLTVEILTKDGKNSSIFVFAPGFPSQYHMIGCSLKKFGEFWYLFAVLRDKISFPGKQSMVRLKLVKGEYGYYNQSGSTEILHNLVFSGEIISGHPFGVSYAQASKQHCPANFNESCTEAVTLLSDSFPANVNNSISYDIINSLNQTGTIARYLSNLIGIHRQQYQTTSIFSPSVNDKNIFNFAIVYTITGIDVTAEITQIEALTVTNSYEYEFVEQSIEFDGFLRDKYNVTGHCNLNGDKILAVDYVGDTRVYLKQTMNYSMTKNVIEYREIGTLPDPDVIPSGSILNSQNESNVETLNTGWSTVTKTRSINFVNPVPYYGTGYGPRTYSSSNAGGYIITYWNPKIQLVSYYEEFMILNGVINYGTFNDDNIPYYITFNINENMVYTSPTINFTAIYKNYAGSAVLFSENATSFSTLSTNPKMAWVATALNKYHAVFRVPVLNPNYSTYASISPWSFSSSISGTTDSMIFVYNSEGLSKSEVLNAFDGTFFDTLNRLKFDINDFPQANIIII